MLFQRYGEPHATAASLVPGINLPLKNAVPFFFKSALRFSLIPFIFLCQLFCMATAAEERPPIAVKAELSDAFITVGDPVEYTISIRHHPSIKVLSIPPPPTADMFEIKKIEEFHREEDGQAVEGRHITLTTFRLGEFILDPLKIDYLDMVGNAKSIQTEQIYLTVKSVAEGEAKLDIRGIKSVISIPAHYREIIVISLAAIFFGILVFFIIRMIKKRREAGSGPATNLSPEESALQALNALFDSDLLRTGNFKFYYLQLSDILRNYFERRLQIQAIESTTDEIIKKLQEKRINTELTEKITEVLQTADLAKFAKWKPEPAYVVRINKQSKGIIEEIAQNYVAIEGEEVDQLDSEIDSTSDSPTLNSKTQASRGHKDRHGI